MENSKLEVTPAACLTAPPQVLCLRQRLLNHLPALNVAISWSSNTVNFIASFVVTPVLVIALGSDYGVWLLLLQFASYLKMLDLGMTSGCMKYTAGSYERGDEAQLDRVFCASIFMFSGSGICALIASGAMAASLPVLYPQMFEGQGGLIFATGLAFVIDLVCRPFAASLRARSLFFVYDAVEIASFLIFKFGLVLYFAHTGISLWWLSALTLGESLVRNGSVIALALRFCHWTRRARPAKADRAMLKLLAGYSSAVFLMSIADLIRFAVDTAVIAHYVAEPKMQVTIYAIAFRLILQVSASIGVIWAVLIPKFSGLYESGKVREMWALHDRSFKVISVLTIFAMFNIGVFGQPFLRLWLRQPWVDESYLIMLIALPAYILSMMQGPANGVLAGTGKLKWQTVATFAEAFLKIILCVTLTPTLGIYGVLLSTVIPMLIFRGLIFPLVLRKELGVTLRWYYGRYVPIAVLALIYTPLIIGFAFIEYRNFFEFTLGCIASTAIFGGVIWLRIPEVREWMRKKLPFLATVNKREAHGN